MLQPASPVKLTLFNLLIRRGNAVGRDVAQAGALLDVVHAPVADVARVVVQATVRGVPLVDLAWGEFAPRGHAGCVRRDSGRRG